MPHRTKAPSNGGTWPCSHSPCLLSAHGVQLIRRSVGATVTNGGDLAWNTEANYPSLSNSDYGIVMSVLNLVVRWWRKVRGIEVRDGTPVERPAARQPPAPSE